MSCELCRKHPEWEPCSNCKITSLQAENKELRERGEAIEKAIHWPGCWDESGYPTLLDAINEINHCTTCEEKYRVNK